MSVPLVLAVIAAVLIALTVWAWFHPSNDDDWYHR